MAAAPSRKTAPINASPSALAAIPFPCPTKLMPFGLFIRLSLASAWAVLAAGCAALPDDRPAISPRSAKRAVEDALGAHLNEAASSDSPQLANVLATYAGEGRRHPLVVVFDSRKATGQILGSSAGVRTGELQTIAEANVVVVFRPQDPTDKRILAEALRGARR